MRWRYPGTATTGCRPVRRGPEPRGNVESPDSSENTAGPLDQPRTPPRRADYDSGRLQLLQEVQGPRKILELYVDLADLLEGVGIGSRARHRSQGVAQIFGSAIRFLVRPAIEDLDDVDVVPEAFDRAHGERAPSRLQRMLQIDETPLDPDPFDGLLRRQSLRHRVFQKEADYLALLGQDLLAADRLGVARTAQLLDSFHGVVVGQQYWRDAVRAQALGHQVRRDLAVERG